MSYYPLYGNHGYRAYTSEESQQFVSITCDGDTRRARANAINALRRRVEQDTGMRLERIYTSRDEAHGFLPRTRVRYRVTGRA